MHAAKTSLTVYGEKLFANVGRLLYPHDLGHVQAVCTKYAMNLLQDAASLISYIVNTIKDCCHEATSTTYNVSTRH